MKKRFIIFCIVLFMITILKKLQKIEYTIIDERTFSNEMREIKQKLDNINYYK